MQRLLGGGAYAVEAHGAEVTLSDGRRVIDLGTWATTVLGHRPAPVVDAVARQLATLPAAPRGLANAATPLLARRLVELAAPSRLEHAWFGANGADVVEAAVKLARLATGRLRVLAVDGGFHGRTLGALSVSPADHCHAALSPLFSSVTYLDVVPDAVERAADEGGVAALVVEVIQGRGPVVPLPRDVLRRWAADAHAAGALVIVDEIQTGLWRAGAFSSGLQLGLDPDVVLFGKSLGGGIMPLSALLCAPAVVAPLEDNPFLHSQTFSGHPLSCAAGLATLDVLPGAVAAGLDRVSGWLAGLGDRLRRHGDVVRSADSIGLMLSICLPSPEMATAFVREAARRGVLLAPCDGDRRVVRALPPLVLTDACSDEAADILDDVCMNPGRWFTGDVVRAGA